jgi:hypothetical protein
MDVEETMEHLFLYNPLSINKWFTIGISWHESSNVFHKLYIAKQQFSKPYFMEIFMIGA